MKKLFIHIGVHKTGTTLLQTVLQKNKNNLSNQSIFFANGFYPIFQKENIRGFFDPKKSDFTSLSKKLNTLNQIKEDAIIISYEGLAGALTLRPPYLYYNSQQSADMLKEITSDFDTYIIVTLRRQDSFIESAYHQMLKWGCNINFSTFTKNHINLESLEWTKLITMYERNFSKENVLVLPYELCIENKTEYISKFFDMFSNSNAIDKNINTISNPSYSRMAMNIALFLNNYLNAKNKMRLRALLLRTFPKKPGEKFQLFTNEQRGNVLKFYENDNKLLFSRYLTEFDDGYYLGKSELLKKEPKCKQHEKKYQQKSGNSIISIKENTREKQFLSFD